MIELPLLEAIVAGFWRVVGEEHLWIGRLLSALFWVAGGAFLFRIATRLTTPAGAIAALSVFLFLPFAVVAGRSFQPDPLMVMLLLATILGLLRYAEQPSGRRLSRR
jgi:4-amino-4-deoxy-L-arabinose transferase-like glycosyltransferase